MKVSQDLKNADIYFSFYSNDAEFDIKKSFNILCKNQGSIKFKIGQNLKLKYVPKIKFKLSDEYQYYDKINRLLKNNG